MGKFLAVVLELSKSTRIDELGWRAWTTKLAEESRRSETIKKAIEEA